MSKWDKYAIDNIDDSSNKWEKYRIKDSKPIEVKNVKDEQLQYSPEEFLVDDYGTRDLAPFKKYWNKRGDNVAKNLSFYNKHIIDNKPYYYEHKPTWKDRAKEIGQGLAGFAGGMADMGESMGLAPNVAKWLGKESKHQDYRTLAKNHPSLRTKNIDTTSYMLRGAGEFLPEILPMAGLGKLARGTSNVLGKAAKHYKVNTGKFGRIGNGAVKFLQTPLTGTNAAGFAGAGAAHGWLHTPNNDGKEKHPEWYEELPTVVAGGLLGGGVVNVGKKSLRKLGGVIPDSNLKNVLKKTVGISKGKSPDKINDFIIDYIKKNHSFNDIDSEYIDLARKQGIPVNLLSSFKNPSESKVFKLAGDWKHPDYKNQLPDMKKHIMENTTKILDKGLIPYKKGANVHNISEDISKKLNRIYEYRKDNSKKNFELAHSKIAENDYVIPHNTLEKLKEFYKYSAKVPLGENTGIDQLNRITKSAIKRLGQDENYLNNLTNANEVNIPLRTMVNMRQAINEQLKKTSMHPGALGKVRYKIAELKPLIDEDIELAIAKGTIKDPDFSQIYHTAKDYHKNYLGPFKDSNLFKNIANERGVEKLDVNDVIFKSLNKKGTTTDLEKLINEAYKDTPGDISKKNLVESTNRLKRIKLQEDLLKHGDAKSEDILKYIIYNEHDPIYDSVLKSNKMSKQIPERLNTEIKPVIEKYKSLKEAYKKHDISNYKETSWDKGIVPDSIVGGLAGAILGNTTSSALTGSALAAIPRVVRTLSYKPIANKLYKTFNDPKNLDKIDNRTMYYDIFNNIDNIKIPPIKKLLKRDTVKKQAPLSLIRKNEGEKWGE